MQKIGECPVCDSRTARLVVEHYTDQALKEKERYGREGLAASRERNHSLAVGAESVEGGRHPARPEQPGQQ